MQLGLSTAAFYGRWETEEAAAAIAAYPVFLQTVSEYEPAFAKLVRRNLGGIPCTSMHPSGIQFENQMFGRSARQRRDAFDLYRRTLDAAASLGASYYVYHGRSTALLSPLPFSLEANLDMMGQMREEAAQRGIEVAWENVSWCQLTNCERIHAVKEAMPDVRFTLDVKQAMRAGEDPVLMAKTMGDRLVNVHVCDWDKHGKLCLPGEGCFRFDLLAQTLREMGYEGPVVLEPYLALIQSDDALRASVHYLRNVINPPEERE